MPLLRQPSVVRSGATVRCCTAVLRVEQVLRAPTQTDTRSSRDSSCLTRAVSVAPCAGPRAYVRPSARGRRPSERKGPDTKLHSLPSDLFVSCARRGLRAYGATRLA